MLIDILEPMGAQFDRLRCEVCQNLFLSPMNTGFLRHAVATVLTVYGIETVWINLALDIPISCCNSAYRLRYWNQNTSAARLLVVTTLVATVLTVYGIETRIDAYDNLNIGELQQCLPFTVLKLINVCLRQNNWFCSLQQCLPFTVLKQATLIFGGGATTLPSCNSAYRLRYWNPNLKHNKRA